VYALDVRSGAKKWTYHTGQPEMVQGAYQAVRDVTVAGGAVYFIDEADSSMYALSATDGSLLWKVGGVATGQGYITVMSGVVIASSSAVQAINTTTAVDPHTGKTLWTQPMGASDLLSGEGVVYETRTLPGSDAEPVTNGTLKALNPTTGAILWRLSGHAYSGLVLVGTTLYANADDALHAFNAQTGAEIWTFSLPKSSAAAVSMWHDGTTLFLTNGTTLVAIDGATHTVRWQIPSTTSPGGVVASGVYCGPDSKDMYGYDASTGAQKWSIQRSTGFASIVSDGGLCITTGFYPAETPIVAVDAKTGAVRWSYTASISSVRTLAADGALFVLGSSSTVIENSDTILRAVSETDGSVLWTFDTQDHLDGSMALG